ncbi:hypothetical protein CXF82_09065 [Shewanella sp. GutDb-MelDb]|nr:hypothetical protein CXF82_09065 [Shewanella sp. GutDb-MelDb]
MLAQFVAPFVLCNQCDSDGIGIHGLVINPATIVLVNYKIPISFTTATKTSPNAITFGNFRCFSFAQFKAGEVLEVGE